MSLNTHLKMEMFDKVDQIKEKIQQVNWIIDFICV